MRFSLCIHLLNLRYCTLDDYQSICIDNVIGIYRIYLGGLCACDIRNALNGKCVIILKHDKSFLLGADSFKAIEAEGKKALIVLSENDSFVIKSAANIPGVKTALVNTINTYDIINADTLVIVKGAVAKIEEVYA